MCVSELFFNCVKQGGHPAQAVRCAAYVAQTQGREYGPEPSVAEHGYEQQRTENNEGSKQPFQQFEHMKERWGVVHKGVRGFFFKKKGGAWSGFSERGFEQKRLLTVRVVEVAFRAFLVSGVYQCGFKYNFGNFLRFHHV